MKISRNEKRPMVHSAVGPTEQDKEEDGCTAQSFGQCLPSQGGHKLNEATSTIGEPIIGSARQSKFLKEIDISRFRC